MKKEDGNIQQEQCEASSEPLSEATQTTAKRSVSDRKLEANRANAARSTGPKTKRGKDICRWNAVKHAMRARALTIEEGRHLPEYEEYRRLHLEMSELATAPEDEVLLDIYINAAWRLRRVVRIEEQLLGKYGTGHEDAAMGQGQASSSFLKYLGTATKHLMDCQSRITALRQQQRAVAAAEEEEEDGTEEWGDDSDNVGETPLEGVDSVSAAPRFTTHSEADAEADEEESSSAQNRVPLDSANPGSAHEEASCSPDAAPPDTEPIT